MITLIVLAVLWVVGIPFATMAINDSLDFYAGREKEVIWIALLWPVMLFIKFVYWGMRYGADKK